MMSSPYGVSTMTPYTSHRIPAVHGRSVYEPLRGAKNVGVAPGPGPRTLPSAGGHLPR